MKRTDYISWDEYFMGVSLLAARRSKDPNTQVGACIVSEDNIIISTGYNGMPKGCSDDAFPWGREGEADIIISFEQLESARWLSYLKKGGTLVSNTQQIDPMPVITGAAVYPERVLERIAALGVNIVAADALGLAAEAGNVKSVNVVLLGIAAKYMGLPEQVWQDAITATVPPKFLEANRKAFTLGYNFEA